ncbi:MAG: DUF5695 domain-containing protein [Acidobacteriaceae bacterium]
MGSLVPGAAAQAPPPPAPPTVTVETPQFTLKLVESSQTVAALLPKGADGFDFTPGDRLAQRWHNGYYHLGDLDLRLRTAGGGWQGYSTSLERHPVKALQTSGTVLAAADLSPTLPPGIPLQITRAWMLSDGELTLRFTLKNPSDQPVEIGSLGIPMIFNNDMTGRTLDESHERCSFDDPSIGEDAGYVQVTRLSGHGPALLVLPNGRTPFEAWRPILDVHRRGEHTQPAPELFHDLTPRGITFEGFYAWMVASRAWQDDEWKNAQPWNPPTSITLQPHQTRIFGVRFVLADSIPDIERTLTAHRRPVAVGVPGYILPTNLDAHLFVSYPEPVESMHVDPQGALTVRPNGHAPNGWRDYRVQGVAWGRARLTIRYRDGLVQTIAYRVIKPEDQAVADLGHFLTTKQWFTQADDPFHRNPSAISYDRQANAQVTQDSRVWIAGLSDEAGADSWLALAMKEFLEPDPHEVAQLEQFVDGVMWGTLQYKDGPRKFGVRKSLFYYQPDALPAGFYRSDLDWTSWTSWNRKASEAVDRSFNYPHVASAYWALYQLARNHPGLVTNHPWQWYLDQACETALAMTRYAPYYSHFGQMEGDVYVYILEDLKREGMTADADRLEAAMRQRADRWKTEKYPFASEMPWDSTGQEEVYAWTKYFHDDEKAEVTIDAILGYDPAIPSWGYNGSARRYWDFIYGGKIQRLERQLHHYGSGINAVPLLSEYREHPADLYLLRVGYGGTMGELSNIDQDGFASAAFHAFPDMLAYDPYSGDYGSGFWGFAANTATYVTRDPALGWLCFGGNLSLRSNSIRVVPLDASRSRLYIAPAGLWITLDAGRIHEASFDSKSGEVRITLDPAATDMPQAILRIAQPAKIDGIGAYQPVAPLRQERGAFIAPLHDEPLVIHLRPAHFQPGGSE